MTVKPNLIAGEWVGGAADPIRNVNPSDVSDVIGLHAAADAAVAVSENRERRIRRRLRSTSTGSVSTCNSPPARWSDSIVRLRGAGRPGRRSVSR